MMVRQHNQIARYLKANSNFTHDKIFNETRNIVGAIYQRITYGEFLPAVIEQENVDDVMGEIRKWSEVQCRYFGLF